MRTNPFVRQNHDLIVISTKSIITSEFASPLRIVHCTLRIPHQMNALGIRRLLLFKQ